MDEVRTQDAQTPRYAPPRPAERDAPERDARSEREKAKPAKPAKTSSLRALPILVTLMAVAIAGLLGWAVWDAYLIAPWTRDATVRAYVVTEASEVAGRLVSLPVHADEFVTKGQLLMQVEPTDYEIAVANAEANVEQAQATLDNARAEDKRRQALTTLSTSIEEKETYATRERSAEATLKADIAMLGQARVNLERTRIVSPVNGYITNLDAQLGDYVNVGERVISVVNSDSFWIDGYFEETQLGGIRLGDQTRIYLMGYRAPLWGHVGGIARGIQVSNATPDSAGLAEVNPVFTWIRLAQRIPVRVQIDQVPPGVVLAQGMTATVQINPHTGHGVELLHSLAPWNRAIVPPPVPPAQAVPPDISPPPAYSLSMPKAGPEVRRAPGR